MDPYSRRNTAPPDHADGLNNPTALNSSWPWSSFQPFGEVRENDPQFQRTPSLQAKNWPRRNPPQDGRTAAHEPAGVKKNSTNWRLGFIYLAVLLLLSVAATVVVALLLPCQKPGGATPCPETPTTTPVSEAPSTCSPPKCSSHGTLDTDGSCRCEDGWTGDFCENAPETPVTMTTAAQTTASPDPDPTPVSPGDSVPMMIPPGEASHVSFTLDRASDVVLQPEAPLPTDGAISVFGRRGEIPNYAVYDVHEVFSPAGALVVFAPAQHVRLKDLTAGLWYLAFYNGGPTRVDITIAFTFQGVATTAGTTTEAKTTSAWSTTSGTITSVTNPSDSTTASISSSDTTTAGTSTSDTNTAGTSTSAQETTVTMTTAAQTTASPDPDPTPVSPGDSVPMVIPPGEASHVSFTLDRASDVVLQPDAPLPTDGAISVFGRRGEIPNYAVYDVHEVLNPANTLAVFVPTQEFRLKNLAAGLWYLAFYNGGPTRADITVSFNFQDPADTTTTSSVAMTTDTQTTAAPITCPTTDGAQETTVTMTTAEQTTASPVPDPTQVSRGDSVPMMLPPGAAGLVVTFTLNGVTDVVLQSVDPLPADSAISVFGRRVEIPNYAVYDVHEVFTSAQDLRLKDLAAGLWYLVFYNGGSTLADVTIAFNFQASAVKCPDDCNARGVCDSGTCRCIQGWMGDACQTIDRVPCIPNNCTEHGRPVGETCQCDPGWTGQFCQLKECMPQNCNNQGNCVEGTCICDMGWTGDMCDEVDCIPSDCNGRGVCVAGACVCGSLWQGATCQTAYAPCPNDCSGNGDCNNVAGTCNCTDKWLPPDCSTLSCDDCSEFGACDNGSCVCNEGYTGRTCTERLCNSVCDVHGYCDDGTCVCDKGWAGEDCTDDVCPRNCSFRGNCEATSGSWKCQCDLGFEGADCRIGKELICDNGIDDDADGLTDCSDPECCMTEACGDDPSCQTVVDPVMTAPPSNTSTTSNFYDQVSFLFDGNVTQIGAKPDIFDANLVCVLRGSVLTTGGEPHPGVKVAVTGKPDYGHTLSRMDGRYDMALNCGGRESVAFSKTHFLSVQRTVDTQIQSFQEVQDVILIPLDAKTTEVMSNSTEIQEVEGSMVTDEDGSRQLVMFFKPNTTIGVMTEDGMSVMLESANVRVTEFTVGEAGEQTMPAPLPPAVAFTYAVEISIDELDVTDFANSSSSVVFSQPVPFYTDNFLGFPVGSAVPVGFLDRASGQWVTSDNGRVVLVLEGEGDQAGLDVKGFGMPATDEEKTALQITDDELKTLKFKYGAGRQLWRVQITHMTPYDCNFPYGPPPDSCSPAECGKIPDPNPDPCGGSGPNSNTSSRRKRSIGAHKRRRKRSAQLNQSGGASTKNGLKTFGDRLNPRMTIENWVGVYSSDGSQDTCPVVGGTCGLMYTEDISLQSPTRMLLTIPGTQMAIIYNYFRQPGYRTVINIPLSGAGIPEHVRSIQLEIQVAGVSHFKKFTTRKNAAYNFVWDRLDAYGRLLQGQTTAQIRIGYEYELVYYAVPSDFQASFNRFSDANLQVRVSRPSKSAVFWIEKQAIVGGNTLPEVGLGGWTLANHHSFDIATGTLYKGTGEHYTISNENVMRTLIGTGQSGSGCQACGEGPGTEARITAPMALVESATGVLYLGEYNFIRKYDDGIVTTLAQLPWSVRYQYFMVLNPVDGTLLISDPNTRKIYSIPTQGDAAGQISTLAGTGSECPDWEVGCGDGGPANAARFTSLRGIAVGRDGNIFVVDSQRIRQIGNDGRISNYVGSNRRRPITYRKLSERYSQPFDQLTFENPTKIVVDNDETMYIVDQERVFRLSKEGTISIVAGMPTDQLTGGYRKRNPTGTASEHEFDHPLTTVSLSTGGNLYIGESNLNDINRIHRVNPQEDTIAHIAGKDSPCSCSHYRCSCYGGEGTLPLEETIYAPMDVVFTKKGNLIIADQGNRRVRSTRILALNNVVEEREYVFPDQTQTELYVFSSQGYHLRTLNAFTKGILVEFRYNDDMQLVALVDGYNRTLQIQRRSDGRLDALVAPTGESTVVTLDGNGMLQTMVEPNGISSSFEYDSEGLMTTHTPPNGCQQTYQYSTYGRLTKIYRGQDIVQEFTKSSSAAGGQLSQSKTLTGRSHLTRRVKTGSSITVVQQLGDSVEYTRQNMEARDTFTVQSNKVQVQTKISPGGLWGASAPILSYFSTRMPSGRKRLLQYTEIASPASENPLTATLLRRQVQMNGQLVQTLEENFQDKSVSIFYQLGGSEVLYEKAHYDNEGRIVRVSKPWEGLGDRIITYSDNSYTERQHNTWNERQYNNDGNLIQQRDYTGLVFTYGYNANQQRISTTFPSGKQYGFEYDDCGNMRTLVMPNGARHELNTTSGYHKSELSYKNEATQTPFIWETNPDNELVKKIDQDGNSITRTYDELYRLTSIKYDEHLLVYDYDPGASEPCIIRKYTNKVRNSDILQTFDGNLLTKVTVTNGPSNFGFRFGLGFNVGGSDAEFNYEYSNNFWLIKILAVILDDQVVIDIGRNEVGMVTSYDDFAFTRRSDSNEELTDGVITCVREHNEVGFPTTSSCNFGSSNVFTYTTTMDPNATVIIERSVQFNDQPELVETYMYDVDGQLVEVREGDQTTETYSYDLNGNRVSWMSHGKSHIATYDREDRITSVDGKSYVHSDSGFLLTAGSSSTFRYNSKGELERAVVNNAIVDYSYDAVNRLILKTSSKSKIQFFYGDPENPLLPSHVALNNDVIALYYSTERKLIGMKSRGQMYYVVCDHNGTPLGVFDSNGFLRKQMSYDSFGVLLSDTNPAFYVPLGFAGGIYDADTRIVHFHFRDYMPSIGRWIARDPSYFSSAQPNLYQYVFNDPINLKDPLGLFCIGLSIYAGLGGGGSLCFDKSGATVCGEAGYGLGAAGTIDPLTGPNSNKGLSSELGVDASYSYKIPYGAGADGGISLKYNSDNGGLLDPCAYSIGVSVGAGYIGRRYNYDGSVNFGNGKVTHKPTISQSKWSMGEKLGGGAQAKGYGKACWTF